MATVDQVVTNTKSQKSIKAKQNLNLFVEKIDKELEKYFNSEIKKPFGISKRERQLSVELLKHIKEHNLRPAKRLRGSFIYYAYLLLGGKTSKAIAEAALSIELVHTALLIHDDFMDQDKVRRNKPTTHVHFETIHKASKYYGDSKHWGESIAVDTGDLALCLGFEILGKSNFRAELKLEALNRLLRGIANTAIGQAYDITIEAQHNANEKDILDLHYAKTAIYTYENPLHIGAILAGAKTNDLKIISEYATPGGIAFQLQDDILGMFGDSEKTGKSDFSDLKQGKVTLLIIKALEKATKLQKKTLLSIWGNPNITTNDAKVARQIITDTGSLEYSIKTSIKLAKKAQIAIPKMKAKGWNIQAIDYLDGIAQYMVEREL